jgi:hypothetical protein
LPPQPSPFRFTLNRKRAAIRCSGWLADVPILFSLASGHSPLVPSQNAGLEGSEDHHDDWQSTGRLVPLGSRL